MAERFLINIIKKNTSINSEIEVSSAGLHKHNISVPENTIRVMSEAGVDLSDFQSKPVSNTLIENANLILTMTSNIKEDLLIMFPKASIKTFTLTEYVDVEGDVFDPYDGPIELYRDCAGIIERLVNLLTRKLSFSPSSPK